MMRSPWRSVDSGGGFTFTRGMFGRERSLSGDRRPLNSALTLGFSMAVGMGLFTGLGWWLDRRRGGGILWTMLGAGLGLLYIAYETWKVVREIGAEDRRQKTVVGRQGKNSSF